jgi:hypothetical protein
MVKKIFIVGILLTIFVVVGCSNRQNNLIDELESKNSNFKTFRNSCSLTLHKNRENEFIVIVSYLKDKSLNEERFIVAVSDINLKVRPSFFNLNGKKAKSFSRVTRGDIPNSVKNLVPQWANLYYLSFPSVKSDKILLKFILDGESGEIAFYKKRKYVVEKSSLFKSFNKK